VFHKITKLGLIPLVLGLLALTGCATGPSQTSTSIYEGPSDWSFVGSDPGGDSYFIDYGTIRRNGDYAKVAQKHISQTPEIFCNGISPARSALFIGEYNCRTGQTRSLLSAAYSGPDLDGELVFGSDASSPWRRVVPGTVSASILKSVCNESQNSATSYESAPAPPISTERRFHTPWTPGRPNRPSSSRTAENNRLQTKLRA